MTRTAETVFAGRLALLNAPVGPLWHELTPQQRQILTPVASEWNGFSGPKKQRLLNVAKRYPDMSPAE